MPRYFFDVHDGVETKDDQGTVLDSVASARIEASETLLGLARDFALYGHRVPSPMSIVVRDANGQKLLTVSLIYSEEPPE